MIVKNWMKPTPVTVTGDMLLAEANREDPGRLQPAQSMEKARFADARFDITAVQQAVDGRIAIVQFHGVPDRAHPWVHTAPELFDAYMNFLAVNKYRVVALRDLARFVDANVVPDDPFQIVEVRKKRVSGDR